MSDVSADGLADSDVGLYDILPLHLLDLMDIEYMTLLYNPTPSSTPTPTPNSTPYPYP